MTVIDISARLGRPVDPDPVPDPALEVLHRMSPEQQDAFWFGVGFAVKHFTADMDPQDLADAGRLARTQIGLAVARDERRAAGRPHLVPVP